MLTGGCLPPLHPGIPSGTKGRHPPDQRQTPLGPKADTPLGPKADPRNQNQTSPDQRQTPRRPKGRSPGTKSKQTSPSPGTKGRQAATAADGTHPTGMHSVISFFILAPPRPGKTWICHYIQSRTFCKILSLSKKKQQNISTVCVRLLILLIPLFWILVSNQYVSRVVFFVSEPRRTRNQRQSISVRTIYCFYDISFY